MPAIRPLIIFGASALAASAIAMVNPATSNASCLLGIPGLVCHNGVLVSPTSTGIVDLGPFNHGIANIGAANGGIANIGAGNVGVGNLGGPNLGILNIGSGHIGVLGIG